MCATLYKINIQRHVLLPEVSCIHNTIIPKKWTNIPYLPSTMDTLHEVRFKLQIKYNEYGHKYERYPTSSIVVRSI